jgi:hypothetical protein
MALDDWFGVRHFRPVSITIATPGVCTSDSHGLETGDKVILQTTGALPTGLSVDTYYFVIEGTYSDSSIDPDTFKLASSLANALAGTAITTSGSQSGTHHFSAAKLRGMRPARQNNR